MAYPQTHRLFRRPPPIARVDLWIQSSLVPFSSQRNNRLCFRYTSSSGRAVSVGDLFEDTTIPTEAVVCCATLNSTLSGKVFTPDPNEYQAQGASYYSLMQSDLKPTCRVSPTTADDVSSIVGIAAQNGYDFAVRSGGHMSWKGSSNIGPSGFTIDRQKLNSVSLSNDRSVVSICAGARWTVYRFLDPYNLTTVGGGHMSWKDSPNIGPSGFAMPYCGRPGFSPGLTVQPINAGLVAAGSWNGGNPIGISTDDGDLATSSASAPLPDSDAAAILTFVPPIKMLLGSVLWSDTADPMIWKFQEFSERAGNEAYAGGLLNSFL